MLGWLKGVDGCVGGGVHTRTHLFHQFNSIHSPDNRPRAPGTTRVHPADSRRARWAYGILIGSVWPLLRSVAIWGMLVLSFFEAPTWCLRQPDACHPGTDVSALYPR